MQKEILDEINVSVSNLEMSMNKKKLRHKIFISVSNIKMSMCKNQYMMK